MNPSDQRPSPIEEKLRRIPLDKTPGAVRERLQRESNLDKFESAPIWPYVLMVVALALVLLITRQLDKARTIEPPTWIERPAAEAADDRLPAEAPDPGPLVPTLATPPIPAPLLALSPSSSVIDEAELYNLRVPGLEPTFSSTFGESAMAPWQSSLDS